MSCYTKVQNKDKDTKHVEAPPEALQKRLAKQPLPMSLTQREQKPARKGVLGPEDSGQAFCFAQGEAGDGQHALRGGGER